MLASSWYGTNGKKKIRPPPPHTHKKEAINYQKNINCKKRAAFNYAFSIQSLDWSISLLVICVGEKLFGTSPC
jgi:hypothetical protein